MNTILNNECFLCNNIGKDIITMYDKSDFLINKVKKNYSCYKVCEINSFDFLKDTTEKTTVQMKQYELFDNTDIIIINVDKNNIKNFLKNIILNFIDYLMSVDIHIPILFLCEGKFIKHVYKYLKTEYIFDVLNDGFCDYEFKNKLNTLLKISKYQKNLKNRKLKIDHALWDLLNYSNLFIVILDKNFNIVLCSDHLSKTLGYKNPKELIGQYWINFIPLYLKEKIVELKNNIFKEKTFKREFINEIVDKNGKELTIKWFNSFINHEINWSLSIGVPFKTYDDTDDGMKNINGIRSYFNDILERDKVILDSLQKNTMDLSKSNKLNLIDNKNIDHWTQWLKRRNTTYQLEL